MLNRLRQCVRARPGLVYWLLLLCVLGSGLAPAAMPLTRHAAAAVGNAMPREHCAMPSMAHPDAPGTPDCCAGGHCDCAVLHFLASLPATPEALTASFDGVAFARVIAPRPPDPAHTAPQRPPIRATA